MPGSRTPGPAPGAADQGLGLLPDLGWSCPASLLLCTLPSLASRVVSVMPCHPLSPAEPWGWEALTQRRTQEVGAAPSGPGPRPLGSSWSGSTGLKEPRLTWAAIPVPLSHPGGGVQDHTSTAEAWSPKRSGGEGAGTAITRLNLEGPAAACTPSRPLAMAFSLF